jgi:hypothetical protein
MSRTIDEFTKIFYDILEYKLPEGKKGIIFARWKKNTVPLVLLDSEIEELEKDYGDIPYAAVLTDHFNTKGIAFREFVRNEATDIHLHAIIQHELVHCYRGSAILEAHLQSQDSFRGSGYTKDEEERRTTKMNLEWGCDDRAALAWCEAWTRKNDEKDRSV